MRWIASIGILWLLYFLAGCQLADAPVDHHEPSPALEVSDSKSVRLATWNVRNLFDDVDSPNDDEVLSAEDYRLKLSDLAEVLNGLKADFIALEEVENIEALKALNQRLTEPYPLLGLIEGNDTQRGIDVGFLSRIPIERVRSHKERDLPDLPGISRHYKFSRDCLEVRLGGQPSLTILINHFKSQRGDKKSSAVKRRAQSIAVSELVAEIAGGKPARPVIVMGDLNDRPDSWAVEPLFSKLHDPFASLPSKRRVTHRYRGGGSALDHILLNEAALGSLGPAKIWTQVGRKTSDHDPVSVEFRLSNIPRSVEQRIWQESD